jgi:Zn-dependent peptidase ImmA (M78 family)/transcriptional regulator with XRE-family HTH domain
MTSQLNEIIESTGLGASFCAGLVGVSDERFEQWLKGSRSLPAFVLPELSSILGISIDSLEKGEKLLEPAIWFKLRDARLTSADREMVGLIRKLGFYMDQLRSVFQDADQKYCTILKSVRESIDKTSHPITQGQSAAICFRSVTCLDNGQSGIGEVIRPASRAWGLLIVESPLKSTVEGCSFNVGNGQTPCMYANTYKTSWFQRNAILMHELAHVIFDLEDEQVTIDFKHEGFAQEQENQLRELRAHAFSRECLVPKTVLTSVVNLHGIKWSALSKEDLAQLIAATHVHKSFLLRAALAYGFVDPPAFERYMDYECDAELRKLSTHALPAKEYFKTLTQKSPKWIAENRSTSLGARVLRLPLGYLVRVLEAYRARMISLGKAAEMMMTDEGTFLRRFENLAESGK